MTMKKLVNDKYIVSYETRKYDDTRDNNTEKYDYSCFMDELKSEAEHKIVIRMDVLNISSLDTKRYIFGDTTNKRKKLVLNDNYLTIRFNEDKTVVVNLDTGSIEQ